METLNATSTVLVTGASGLLGSALRESLDVRPLPRGAAWDPEAGRVDPDVLRDADAVVHLAGENIASGRWTPERKARIRGSRVAGTRALAVAIASLPRPPRVLVCASAVGIYGDRGDEALTESSRPGAGFLAELCQDWEDVAEPARHAGVRVVHLRFGVILSPKGGALARMLTPFRLGLGGRLGSGRQHMSWISLPDAAAVVRRALEDERLRGAVNAVAPFPVTNAGFTRALGAALRRPALFPMPAFAARLAFGELADALLLSSARVFPDRLSALGFEFRHPSVESALKEMLR
jgi:uncharacterized protein (TIGR01777 family)